MASVIRRTTGMNSRFAAARRVNRARTRARYVTTFVDLHPTSFPLPTKEVKSPSFDYFAEFCRNMQLYESRDIPTISAFSHFSIYLKPPIA
uniref:Uncharacterized protein n=1 Tax=Ascaris lumbricoides TaxID=6252 RepID=A0A0M3I6V3_ASCLU